jgi:hypothetical protein
VSLSSVELAVAIDALYLLERGDVIKLVRERGNPIAFGEPVVQIG